MVVEEFFSPLRRQTKRREERRERNLRQFKNQKNRGILHLAFCISIDSTYGMQLFFMPKSLSLSKVHNLIDVVRTFDYLTAREEH